ncbi:MAG: DUF1573 domain-containing protein [Planctomycetes bacterium]|nr:DUF1573 domain-containing protein [Planctomycetota bacterium]
MAIWAALCLVIVFAFLACAIDFEHIVVTESELQNRDVPGQASLHVSNPVRDLGRRTCESELIVVFPIQNRGTRRLVVNEMDIDNCCGDRVLRTFLVSPGETAHVVVTFDPSGKSGPVATVANFTTNDPTQPRFSLTMKAQIDASKTAKSFQDRRPHRDVSP